MRRYLPIAIFLAWVALPVIASVAPLVEAWFGVASYTNVPMNRPITDGALFVEEGPSPTVPPSLTPTATPCSQVSASVGTQCDFRFNTAGSTYGLYHGELVRNSGIAPVTVGVSFYLEVSSDGTNFDTLAQTPVANRTFNPGTNTLTSLFDNVTLLHQYSFYRVRMQIDNCTGSDSYYSLVMPVCRPAVSPTPSPLPSPGCPTTRSQTFRNPIPIDPDDRVSNDPGTDPGLPFLYPSTLQSSGRPDGEGGETSFGVATGVSFTIGSERPDDLDVLLEVFANGGTLRSTVLISDAGGEDPITNRTYTIGGMGGTPFPDNTAPDPGRYRIADYPGLPATEPDGMDNFPGVSGLAHYPLQDFSNFTGGNPSGNWRLYVVDDETGHRSTLPNGWSLDTVTQYTQGGGCILIPTPTPSPSITPITPTPSPTPTARTTPTPCSAGSLDTTFDGDGIVVTSILSGDRAAAVAIQPDGKIVVAGVSAEVSASSQFALARYNTDGSLDTTFDGDGKVTTSFVGGSQAHGIAIQPDGKLVAVGYTFTAGFGEDFAIARYNVDGSLDPTFDGDGKVVTNRSNFSDRAHSVAIQTDGRILLGGTSHNGQNYDFALFRYNGDGSLDTSFGIGGMAVTPILVDDIVYSIAIQPTGKIVAGGLSYGFNYDFAAARYNSNGLLDTSFDGNGTVTTQVLGRDDFGESMILQPDGKIIVAGYVLNASASRYEFGVVRYNTNGSLDTTFDGDGKLTTSIYGHDEKAYSVVVQPDGGIVVVGSSLTGPTQDFAVVRYNRDGSLDNTFGGEGKITTSILPDTFGEAHAAAIQQDGKIVAAGWVYASSGYDFAVVRYNGVPCGQPPPTPTPTPSPVAFDFDGDSIADIGVYRPSTGIWYLDRSHDGFAGVAFGLPTDLITPADFDGDRKADIAVFRQSNLTWYRLNSSTGGFVEVLFSVFPGAQLPTPADYDGDGLADVSEYTSTNGYWNRLNSSDNQPVSVRFGLGEDKPTVGDYDGDRRADIALFRPSTNIWYRLNSLNGAFFAEQFGSDGDLAVPADYDGDGLSDIAVFRPSEGNWYLDRSRDGFMALHFGISGDIPVPADYDGDGKADIAVFRPSQGIWYRLNSSNGAFSALQWGLNGDVPIPSAFIY